ncbi:hypothetical protein [Saccharopolyspora pogona]|uniref:hypothetical protein n=1 Tax=Saccharopolyspora pogona TaxID=333966 RepID=UPI001686891F|nr:hypothetical protein [Saccharopolyspora pogona]
MTDHRTVTDAVTAISRLLANLEPANRDEVLRQVKSRYTTTTERDLYRERATLLAYLAAHHPSALSNSDEDEPRLVLTWYPEDEQEWQVTHHIDRADLDLFDHVSWRERDDEFVRWDGHCKSAALDRIEAATDYRAHSLREIPMTNREQERTERLLALARRQVPAQAALVGAQQRGDTEAAKEAKAVLDDIDRQVREIEQEKEQDR